MNRAAVFHVSDYIYAYAVGPDTICVRLLAARGDLKKASVYFRNMYEHVAPMRGVPMTRILRDAEHDVFEARVTVPEKRFRYYFELEGDETVFYTSNGFLPEVTEADSFFFPYINPDDIPTLPQWAAGGMIYQLLVDRFFDGDPANNPPDCRDWSQPPDRETFYGGDFEGIRKKLDYIRSLGTNILYLSPVFQSPSYHKYDVEDYYTIEGIYGGAGRLRTLVEQAHEKGVAVILDGVFNHASERHAFFQDLLVRGEDSPYRDWFCAKGFPIDRETANYDSFGGVEPRMPRWNTANPEVARYLTDAALHWTRELGIDGWRLDVADEISDSFWRHFRAALRAYKPDLLLIGEIWNHATRWTMGDALDTSTNYKYRKAILDLAAGRTDAAGFWNAVQSYLRLYKTPQFPYLVNLVGSHDTTRLATALWDEALAQLALLCTLCFEGMPLVYYGDELGLQGNEDPDNRRAMPWGTKSDLLEAVRAVASLRESYPALRRGTTRPVAAADRLLTFTRNLPGETLRIAANFGDAPVQLDGTCDPLYIWRGDSAAGSCTLARGGLAILREES